MPKNGTISTDLETPSRKCCIAFQLFQRPKRVSCTPGLKCGLLTKHWIAEHDQGQLLLVHAVFVNLAPIRVDQVCPRMDSFVEA